MGKALVFFLRPVVSPHAQAAYAHTIAEVPLRSDLISSPSFADVVWEVM